MAGMFICAHNCFNLGQMRGKHSLTDVLAAMSEVIETDGTVRKRFNAVVEFDVDGTTRTFDARKSTKETSTKADLRVKTSLPVLQSLLAKNITPQQAFMSGKLKIKGKMGLAMKLTVLLDATRKRIALQSRL